MHTHQLISLLIVMLALVVSVEAGTKKSPPKEPEVPTTPIDRPTATLRQIDPKGQIVGTVRAGEGAHIARIVVTDVFHPSHRQSRLQMPQGFAAAWHEINWQWFEILV